MRLCSKCYDKLKDAPNIVKTGGGRSCFGGGAKCDECEKRMTAFVIVEISNKNIEHTSSSD